MRDKHAVIRVQMNKKKAKEIPKLLGIENFVPNNSWLRWPENKENVSFQHMLGE